MICSSDGVGNGQFKLCKEFEFPQLKTACRLLGGDYNPKITFIVVQKRINTRIFTVISTFLLFICNKLTALLFLYDIQADSRANHFDNPPPGTVVDHSITRRGLFDFYLVSQKMRHGTATPCHYVVIENETNLSPDILQQMSYKLTYQYFNWPGSIRVPAPCQVSNI